MAKQNRGVGGKANRPNTADGGIDDLGVLLAAALHLDTDWKAYGKCRQWRYEDDPDGVIFRPSPWHGATKSIIVGDTKVSPREMVKVALSFCHGCPVQWDCARFAVAGLSQAGVWSMSIKKLKALQRNPERAMALIHDAQDTETPMQVAVASVDDDDWRA